MQYSKFDIDAAVAQERQRTENTWFKFVVFLVVILGACGVLA